jgi:hypothetical protein
MRSTGPAVALGSGSGLYLVPDLAAAKITPAPSGEPTAPDLAATGGTGEHHPEKITTAEPDSGPGSGLTFENRRRLLVAINPDSDRHPMKHGTGKRRTMVFLKYSRVHGEDHLFIYTVMCTAIS